jgi:hypothetical protein
MLIATVFGVVPVVIGLLSRALTAARGIERYTVEILQSGVGIANNTAEVAALKDTLAAAPGLVAGAGSIEGHASTIRTVLGGETSASEGVSSEMTDVPNDESNEGVEVKDDQQGQEGQDAS